jgi:hypothetical protein
MNFRNNTQKLLSTSIMFVLVLGISTSQAFADSTDVPSGEAVAPQYVTVSEGEPASVGDATVRVYQDSIPWFGENRDAATLVALGKTLGVDYFVHPTSDLLNPIPGNTDVVIITSDGQGNGVGSVNDAAAQANLDAFVQAGGVLIVDMGDNNGGDGFMAPGSTGIADDNFPSPCDDATLTMDAAGDDNTLGTADDHPLVKGPDGIAGTVDDWTNDNIDLVAFCFIAHAHLNSGITLPANAVPIMTALFNNEEQTIVAEYTLGEGCVIVDTLTKEYEGQSPVLGNGPTTFMTNLFTYAMEEACNQQEIVGGEFLAIDSAALLVAGAQANAIWILSALAVIGSVAFGALYITSKRD